MNLITVSNASTDYPILSSIMNTYDYLFAALFVLLMLWSVWVLVTTKKIATTDENSKKMNRTDNIVVISILVVPAFWLWSIPALSDHEYDAKRVEVDRIVEQAITQPGEESTLYRVINETGSTIEKACEHSENNSLSILCGGVSTESSITWESGAGTHKLKPLIEKDKSTDELSIDLQLTTINE